MKILHFADLHIDASFSKELSLLSNKFNSERFFMLDRLLNYIEYNEIDIIIIAGDLFDKENVDKILMYKLETYLKKILEKGIILVYSSGNHDFNVNLSNFNRIKNFENFIYFFNGDFGEKEIVVNNDIVVFHSISYNQRNPEKNVYENFTRKQLDDTKIHIGILHGEVDNIYSKYYHINKFEIESLNYDYFAMGHLHTPTKINERCYYPGGFLPRFYEDNSCFGGLLVNLDSIGINVENIRFSNFNIINASYDIFAINYDEMFEKIIGIINNNSNNIDFKENFYNLKINLKCNFLFDNELKNKLLEDIFGDDYQYQNILFDVIYVEDDLELNNFIKNIVYDSYEEVLRNISYNDSYMDKYLLFDLCKNNKNDVLSLIEEYIKYGSM